MQLTLHMDDGRQYRYTIADGQPSIDFLGTVQYWEVFDRPILRIHARNETWAFHPDAIEKIHFLTTEDPGWRPPENILQSKCISRESYRSKLAVLDTKPPVSEQNFKEGKALEAVLKIMLASGTVDYLECFLMLRQRREQMSNLYNLFPKVAYAIPCESGGFVLFNPRRIVCIHLHPAPPEPPDSAWLVDEFAGTNPD